MATSIYVNNTITSTPGVYSTIDATGLASAGLTATGIVAILGTAENGVPYTAAGTNAQALPRLTNAQQLKNTFRSGDLLEAGNMLFDPSSDPFVLGGARVVIAVQVNPAAAASLTLDDADGDPALTIAAKGYGTAGNEVTVEVADASTPGNVLVTIRNTTSGALEVYNNLASLDALVDAIKASALVTATKAADATDLPAAIAATALAGGAENTATFDDWQKGLNLLKQLRVNSVVALTGDPAVASAVEAHCAYMCGIGRSERDGFVGIAGQGDALPTLTEVKDAAKALNSRHMRVFGQSVTRFDSKGQARVFPPAFLGALAAGMQAGAGLGQPLTRKFIKCLAIAQHPSWSPMDNADELINAGVIFAQAYDGLGIRWVRNVTTYLTDNNLAFVEASTNASINYVAFTLRQALEFAVGQPGFAGTANAVRTLANATLQLLVEPGGVISAYTKAEVTVVNDAFQVSVGVSPALPVNFVVLSISLNPTELSTAQAA